MCYEWVQGGIAMKETIIGYGFGVPQDFLITSWSFAGILWNFDLFLN